MNKSISVIIPFLNEEENIPALIDAINIFVASYPGVDYEFIFVDDGSTDRSVSLLLVRTLGKSKFKIIKLAKNFGSHSALRAGIVNAKSEFITFMYADLQDPLELIRKMHEECLAGNDIVWATRAKPTGGFMEKIFSKIYAWLMRRFVIKNFPFNGFDVVMFSQKVQIFLNQNVESNSSVFLQLLTLGFRQKSVTYEKSLRKHGKSKWTLGKKIKLFVDSFVAFSYAPIRLVSVIGLLLFIVGFSFSSYLILRKLLFNDLAQGWAMLISILMLGFGITNISLGIIAEYLWRTLDAARKREVFIIDEIIDLSANLEV